MIENYLISLLSKKVQLLITNCLLAIRLLPRHWAFSTQMFRPFPYKFISPSPPPPFCKILDEHLAFIIAIDMCGVVVTTLSLQVSIASCH